MRELPAEVVVSVTIADIAAGVPTAPCLCPIARAAPRQLGEFDGQLRVDEDLNGLRIALYRRASDAEEEYAVYSLPVAARGFVHAFDDGRVVLPFEFTAHLEKPSGA